MHVWYIFKGWNANYGCNRRDSARKQSDATVRIDPHHPAGEQQGEQFSPPDDDHARIRHLQDGDAADGFHCRADVTTTTRHLHATHSKRSVTGFS